jgi:hypothetical protein
MVTAVKFIFDSSCVPGSSRVPADPKWMEKIYIYPK